MGTALRRQLARELVVLGLYEKFEAMIERHWDGIATDCKPENKVSVGFVEGLNYKIRVIQ